MNLLLDTHVLLWYLAGDSRLSAGKRNIVEDQANSVFVSVASLWEMAIKASLGKLELMDDIATIESILLGQGFTMLPIQTSHLLCLMDLLFHHRDPFDRLIISQALAEQMTVLSDDGKFGDYPVSLDYAGN